MVSFLKLILHGIFLKYLRVISHVEHSIWRSAYGLESSFRFKCIWIWTYFVSNFCVRICVRFQVCLIVDTVRPWFCCVRIRIPFHVFLYGHHASVLRNCLVLRSKDPTPVMWKSAIGLCHEAIHPFPILPTFLPFVSFIRVFDVFSCCYPIEISQTKIQPLGNVCTYQQHYTIFEVVLLSSV